MDLQAAPEDRAPRTPETLRRWALVDDADALRATVWGRLGAAEIEEIDERLATLQQSRVPLIVDLTGVTDLRPEAVTWLGARDRKFGPGRPMLVVVIADGPVHALLTRPDAPRLRLTLE